MTEDIVDLSKITGQMLAGHKSAISDLKDQGERRKAEKLAIARLQKRKRLIF